MPPPAAVLSIVDQMPALVVGPFAGSAWWMPKPATTRQALTTAIGGASFTLRTVRLYVCLANGRMDTREVPARVFANGDVLMTPAGWIGSGNTATARPIPAGVTVLGARNVSAAGADAEPVVVTHDHFVAVTAAATAQRVLANGSLGPVVTLPFGVVAGPSYGWQNPAGPPGSLAPVPITETSAGAEWPETAPKG